MSTSGKAAALAAAIALSGCAHHAWHGGAESSALQRWERDSLDSVLVGEHPHVVDYFRNADMTVLDQGSDGKKTVARIHLEDQFHEWDGWVMLDEGDEGITFIALTQEPPKGKLWSKGQEADVASTVAAVGAGLAEMNPVPLPVLLPAKLVINEAYKAASFETCYNGIGSLSSLGWGAAAWNVAAIAGLGPVGVVPAIVAGVLAYPEPEERLWACSPYVPEAQ